MLLALSLVSLVAAQAAVDDCSLNRDAIAPILDGAKIKDYAVVRDDEKRSLTERGVVDGRKVSYTVGGCAHFAFSMTFELKREDSGGYVALARKLLASVPIIEKERAQGNQTFLDGALAEAKFDVKLVAPFATMITRLPCGDARCELHMSPTEITVAYDFAL